MAFYIKAQDGTQRKIAGLGVPGKSAYQYAVDGGYEGTEEDFSNELNSIKDKQSQTIVRTVVLEKESWSDNTQTVACAGISANELDQQITPIPAVASQTAYYDAGILCTAQDLNSLTFKCSSVPESDLTVYITIMELEVAT